MQDMIRLTAPRYRRITIRLSFIEIELRTSRPRPVEKPSPAERAYRRARAEEAMRARQDEVTTRWSLGILP